MNTYKISKKKYIRPKSEAAFLKISAPFAFRHEIHVGQTDFEERLVDPAPSLPPAPCPGSQDSSGDTSFQMSTENISQILRQEVIPALRLELEDIIENKIRHLPTQTKYSVIPHCQTCSCSNIDKRSELDLNTDNTNITGAKTNPQINRAGSCTFVYSEDKKEVEIIAVSDIIDHGDGNFISLALNNPLYHSADQAILVQTQHGKKLMKYGSDLQLVRDESLDTGHSVVLSRAHSVPGVAKDVQLLHDIEDNHRGRHLNKRDKRECLARALQCHVGELVDGIIFKDSELPDHLLADGCLTEEECSGVSQKLERKDQVRVLISMIKGRDFEILEKFLRHIRAHNNGLANKIEEKFSQNLKEGVKCSMCALCSLTTQVNLKYIDDALWQKSLIDDGMFNLIVHTDKPTGAQGDLWHRVINYLNSHKTSEVRDVLIEALKIKGHYHHIAKGGAWMINATGELKCRCHIQQKIKSAWSITSRASSNSPQSSESDAVTDSHSIISLVSSQPGNAIVKVPIATREEINQTVLPSKDSQVQSQKQIVLENDTMKKLDDDCQGNAPTMLESRYRNIQEDIAERIPYGRAVFPKHKTRLPDELELKASNV